MKYSGSPLLNKGLPCLDDADVRFAEPWEARALAIIVKLAEDGHFRWSEWVEDYFAKEVAAATAVEEAGGEPKSYYEQWLAAAETLLIAKGLTSPEQLLAKRFAIQSVGTMNMMKA